MINFSIKKFIMMKVVGNADNFIIGNIVTTGENFTVFDCKGELTRKPYFIKKVSKEGGYKSNPMNSLRNLKCENLTRCIDACEDPSNYYAIYNLPNGIPLSEYLKSHGKLSETLASTILKQVLNAVNYLHIYGYGLINLNLSNIYIDNQDYVQILDFSFNCRYKNDDYIDYYPYSQYNAPPEFFQRNQFLVHLADSWSIGILAYTLISGQYPWSNIRQVEEVPSAITKSPPILLHNSVPCTNFIQKMLMVDDTRRFSITQALNHVWITKGKSKSHKLSVKSDEDIGSKLPGSRIARMDFSKMGRASRHSHGLAQKLRKSIPVNSFSESDLNYV